MKRIRQKIKILAVLLVLSVCTPIMTSNSYAQISNQKVVEHVETYTNPQYSNVDVKTYSKTDSARTYLNKSVPTFDSIEKAGEYLRQEMVKRSSTITFVINKSYYQNIFKDIFEKAVEDNGYTSSSEGDYLYANFVGYGARAMCAQNYLEITYNMSYLSTYSQEQQVNKEVKKVLDQLNVYKKDDYTKVKAVHDYIVKNIEYDYTYANHSSYNAIVDKRVVCQGFASITTKMLKELGVGVRYITGLSANGGPHGWNIIKLDNYWYNTDNTWDQNMTSYDEKISYKYFLKGSSEFVHKRDTKYNTNEFNSKFPTSSKSYVYKGKPPVINGVENKTIKVGQSFNERAGITASDKEDGNLTSKIVISGTVNTKKAGTYILTYKVTDSHKNTTTVKRTITVKNNTFKEFTVNSVKATSTSISGKGLKGATVKAYVNGKQIGKTATVNSSGVYKIDIPKQSGGKKIVLKISKSGYTTKEISTTVLRVFPSFTINSVKSSSKSISGKGLKGAQIKVYVNKKQIGKTTTVSSSGAYKVTIPKQKKNQKVTVQMSKSGYSKVEKVITVK